MRPYLLAIISLLLFYNTDAQVFNPPVGSAVIVTPGVYNLTPTPTCSYRRGAIWCTTTIDFNNSFVLTFEASVDRASGSGADGFCVAFGQNITPTSLNATDAHFGYYNPAGGPANPDFNQSFCVEFDFFDNSFGTYCNDIPGVDHIAVAPNAIPTIPCPGGAPVAISPTRTNMKDGLFHRYRIEWCVPTTTLKVFFDDTLRTNSVFDYRTLYTTPAAVDWGLAGGTGALCSNHILRNIVLIPGICSLAATCDSIALVDSIHTCIGDTVTLPAAVYGTNPILSYLWSPATGLSSATILNPLLTVAGAGWYSLIVRSMTNLNLVNNGDFTAGNTGFTSSYTYSPGPSGVLLEGNYSVYNDPFGVHGGFTSFGDHTTGTGQMLILNGGPTPTDVWCQTVTVEPNTDYDFSAWIANCSSITVGPDVPILQFRINGVLIGAPTPITSVPGVWTNFASTWNSGVSTTATICIYDMNTTASGNDFAIDDIAFRKICVVTDSVYINVGLSDTVFTREDTALCISGAPITLYSAPGYASRSWSTGSVAASIIAPASGIYWVRNINNCDVKIDTFGVTYAPFPIVNLGIDTAFCVGNTLVLSSTQPPGYNYLWSDGSSGTSLTVTSTGTYWLQVDNGYCYSADTIRVTISPYPVVDLGPDTFNCNSTPITLQSSVTYTSPAYLWSTGATTPSITTSLSGTYWLQVMVAGCAGSDTINATVIFDTFTLYNPDTAICRAAGNYVPIRLTANPAATFQWLPTAGIATPNIATPRIAPDTSDMYYVYVKIAGCPDLVDSLYIDVQPFPEVDINGFKQVCEFDTLHLHASVTPKWYKYYSFNWSPGTLVDDSTASSVLFKGIDSAKLTLTVTTPAGCSGIDSTFLVVYPGNFANLDTSYHLCPHQEVQLSPDGGVSYRWSPSLYLDDSLSPAPWVRAITSQAYRVIATSQHGCTDTLSTHVIIHPAGHIFLGDSVTIFPGEAYHIKSQTNCSYFSWFPPAGLDNPNVSDPVATPVISTRYIVKARTEWGCEATDSINIYYDISSLIAVPNVFSPSGSGVNSKLYILRRGEATLHYFRIFNRWGNLVFETTDINEGWDGTYKGKPQPLGVFVYEIEAATNTGGAFRKHGNVTLLR